MDGVGIGEPDASVNPFVAAAGRTPALVDLMGGAVVTLDDPHVGRGDGDRGGAFPLDATLGVEGTPQSGTGQVALLTGASAAELHGGHFGPWTPVSLRPLVEEKSLLRRAADAGRTVAFANAYPRGWPGPGGGRRLAGPPLAARGAGALERHEESLAAGTAVASEILNEGWRRHFGLTDLPRVTAEQAGANLARIAAGADLTLFAHYATDTAGHEQSMDAATSALERVDAFLRGVLGTMTADTLLLVASDHGNVEDVRTGHTRNPALGLTRGPGAGRVTDLCDIREVTPLVLELLEIG